MSDMALWWWALTRKGLFLYWTLAACFATTGLVDVSVLAPLRPFVLRFASRGKTWKKNPDMKGGLMGLSVPQSFFSHFYLVAVIWGGYVLSCTAHAGQGSWVSTTNLCCFLLHVSRRFLETVLLMSYPEDARMHVTAYAFGLSYYIAVPLSMLPPPQDSRGSSNVLSESLPIQATLVVVGLLAVLMGFALQFLSHAQLASLRKKQGAQQIKPHYAIPRGLMFEYVSCPHYFAEILIYGGFLAISQLQLLLWLLLWWVVANLSFAGRETHQWYLNHFKEYPRARKAIVPYLL